MIGFTSKHCGRTDQPWTIISNSNTLDIRFRAYYNYGYPGFLAFWSATSEPPTYPTTMTNGCQSCSFPFVLDGRLFDTCTSIDGDQPWCPSVSDQPAAPTYEGTHVIIIKSYCSGSDSSCPLIPPMSTHHNNQPGNCCKFCYSFKNVK